MRGAQNEGLPGLIYWGKILGAGGKCKRILGGMISSTSFFSEPALCLAHNGHSANIGMNGAD